MAAKKARQKLENETGCTSSKSEESSQLDNLTDEFSSNLKLSSAEDNNSQEKAVTSRAAPSLASMFLIIMGIFSILNQIYYKNEMNVLKS